MKDKFMFNDTSAENLTNLIRQTYDGIWETDKNGKLINISQNILDILKEKFTKTPNCFTDIMVKNNNFIEKSAHFKQLINAKISFKGYEFLSETYNNSIVFFQANAVPKYDKSGEFNGFIGAIINTTNIKQDFYAHYLSSNAKVFAKITGALAHEINNPLTIIQFNTEFMDEEFNNFDIQKTPSILKTIKIIKENITRITDLINKFMDLSNQSSNIIPDLYDIEDQLKNVFKVFSKSLVEHKIKYNIKNDCSKKLFMNQEEVFRALLNIIRNSIEAIKNLDTRYINCTIKEEEDLVKLTITDSPS